MWFTVTNELPFVSKIKIFFFKLLTRYTIPVSIHFFKKINLLSLLCTGNGSLTSSFV
jgi:hypothetical protein